MSTTVIEIKNHGDPSDVGHLEKALEAVPGVQFVEIDPKTGRARIEHSDADPRLLVRSIEEQGYLGRVV